ncbi:MAG TPA: hypothetical protein PLB10_08575 [Thiolinea sp.]|nr:hypothetical protein [Thiolinea sp.]
MENREKPREKLHVLVNNIPVLIYDPGIPVPPEQESWLVRMDRDMDQGITTSEGFINDPSALERARLVANTLVSALLEDNHKLAMAMCTWLGSRIPELQQVRAKGQRGSRIDLELVFDRGFAQSQREQPIRMKIQNNQGNKNKQAGKTGSAKKFRPNSGQPH